MGFPLLRLIRLESRPTGRRCAGGDMKSRLIAVVIHKRFIYGRFNSTSLSPFICGRARVATHCSPWHAPPFRNSADCEHASILGWFSLLRRGIRRMDSRCKFSTGSRVQRLRRAISRSSSVGTTRTDTDDSGLKIRGAAARERPLWANTRLSPSSAL